jgi:glucose/mannose transport system substrate-binding protein
LDDVAAAQRWDQLLPKAIADTVRYKGHYYAVPLNVHRVNWLWINERILKESGAAAPANWDQFFVTAEAMKRAGYAAVAYYGRPTQNLLLFEMVVLGVGGPDFHRKALVDYDAGALGGPVMEQVLRTYRRIKDYTEPSPNARVSMERGSSQFKTGKVGMHLMGDWANPAFYLKGKAAPFKSLCVPAPGSDGSFLFTSDAIAMFRSTDASVRKGQQAFAAAIMSAPVQRDYNLFKGSIPARQSADLDRFNGCAVKSAAAFRAATRANTLLPALSMTASREVEDGIQAVVTEFWNDERVSPQLAMRRLVAATRRR